MFRRYTQPCGSSAVHGTHYRWDSDLDRIKCNGILKFEENPWHAANPSIGTRINLDQFNEAKVYTFPFSPPHKHRYRLVYTLLTPRGFPVGRHNIYWRCHDTRCGKIYFVNRQELYEEITRKQVHQTWPQ